MRSSNYVRRTLCLALVALSCMAGLLNAPAAFAAGDVTNARCSAATEASPGFRAFMPECRAYEMVTPPYTAGNFTEEFFGKGSPTAISPSGDRLLGVSFGTYAGQQSTPQEGLQYGGVYAFSRATGGWQAQGIEPPAALASLSSRKAVSSNLQDTLWLLHGRANAAEREVFPAPGTLWVSRPGAGGSEYAQVGPAEPPADFEANANPFLEVVGASDGLGHIFLKMEDLGPEQDFLWPGDETVEKAPSLYEYSGTGNTEPRLVGVTNKGQLTGTPINAHAQLISKCGTALGGANTAYNGISETGAIVYFTAIECKSGPEVDELYARRGGDETIDISEPSAAVCVQCQEAAKRPAEYAGASADGSRVFFTTMQELLPGETGRNLYEYVTTPGHEELTAVTQGDAEVVQVERVSGDGRRVYFVAGSVINGSGANSLGDSAEAGGYNLYAYDASTQTTAFVANLLPHGAEMEADKRGAERSTDAADVAKYKKYVELYEKIDPRLVPIFQKLLAEYEAKLRLVEYEGEPARSDTLRTAGLQVSDAHRPIEITANGGFAVFASAQALTGSEDTSTVPQLFEYDAATRNLARVSIGQNGEYKNDGNVTDAAEAPTIRTPQYGSAAKYGGFDQPAMASSATSLSEGGVVAFESTDALTSQAVQGSPNIYEYADGNVYLIAAGGEETELAVARGVPRLLGITENGESIFFRSTASLVPQAVDSDSAWYDARVEGGFPAPLASRACKGEECLGSVAPAPSLTSPPTAMLPGEAARTVTHKAHKPRARHARARHRRARRRARLRHALARCRRRPRRARARCRRRVRRRFHRASRVARHRRRRGQRHHRAKGARRLGAARKRAARGRK